MYFACSYIETKLIAIQQNTKCLWKADSISRDISKALITCKGRSWQPRAQPSITVQETQWVNFSEAQTEACIQGHWWPAGSAQHRVHSRSDSGVHEDISLGLVSCVFALPFCSHFPRILSILWFTLFSVSSDYQSFCFISLILKKYVWDPLSPEEHVFHFGVWNDSDIISRIWSKRDQSTLVTVFPCDSDQNLTGFPD
jgi:hypothetical protein